MEVSERSNGEDTIDDRRKACLTESGDDQGTFTTVNLIPLNDLNIHSIRTAPDQNRTKIRRGSDSTIASYWAMDSDPQGEMFATRW